MSNLVTLCRAQKKQTSLKNQLEPNTQAFLIPSSVLRNFSLENPDNRGQCYETFFSVSEGREH